MWATQGIGVLREVGVKDPASPPHRGTGLKKKRSVKKKKKNPSEGRFGHELRGGGILARLPSILPEGVIFLDGQKGGVLYPGDQSGVRKGEKKKKKSRGL